MLNSNQNKKLKLNLNSVTHLTNEKMKSIEGGFTYSLSMGSTCQQSNAAYNAVWASDAPNQNYWNLPSTTWQSYEGGGFNPQDRPDNAAECAQWVGYANYLGLGVS